MRGIKSMRIISLSVTSYLTPDNPTSNLERNPYQRRTFSFNGWMEWKQQSTVNVKTKPTVTGIKE